MDYEKLAAELVSGMIAFRRGKIQRNIDESMHGEAFVLWYIVRRGGDVNPGEIGQQMNVSTARVATALNNLEKKGLITRTIDPNNRRHILVGITPEGKELAESHQKSALRTMSKMLEFLGEQDAKDYVRIMKKLGGFIPDCPENE